MTTHRASLIFMVEAQGLKKVTRFDGRLHIFQRPGTPFWWCGFHHKGSYIRKSTKQTDWASATTEAEKWFTLQRAEILTGNDTLGGRTVAWYLCGLWRRSVHATEGIKSVKSAERPAAFGFLSISEGLNRLSL